MADSKPYDGSIVSTDEDGYYPTSVMLKCSCGKRGWHTKNIDYIGARTIYNFAGGCKEMKKMQTCVSECACNFREISVDYGLMEHVKHCPECRQYGF